MKIEKTAFFFEGDTFAEMKTCHTILFEGKKWLVPEWTHNRVTGKSKPTRIICLNFLRHQQAVGQDWEWTIDDPIPRDIFDGQKPPQPKARFVIREDPEIEVDTHLL